MPVGNLLRSKFQRNPSQRSRAIMQRCRVKLSIRIFLVILHGAAVVLLCSWYAELSPFRPEPSSSKVHLLLLSSWRSGSSFLGQVFSQHPSVSYLLEPALHPPPFLEGRYKMVRYEDVALNPLEEINAIYEFVCLELTPELDEWIYHMTHGKGKGKGAFKITSRNATDVSRALHSTLSHNKVKQVQEVCEGAMTLLGYK
ncbi:carbohydrate sulfotransferase 6-like [Tautogolabrus adspersus]